MNTPLKSAPPDDQPKPAPTAANVMPLRPPGRWHDPLKLIQAEAPSDTGRTVLWTVSILMLALIVWAAFGRLDIIATADGKLVPRTLVKIVQPAEAGVVKQLLVNEGDQVRAGQILARLDTTLANADKAGVANDLATQKMQARRIEAELAGRPMLLEDGDPPLLYTQVQNQYKAHRTAFLDSIKQEQSLLTKARYEKRSAAEVLNKLEQTLPSYRKSAAAYTRLENDGFVGSIAAAEKQREATEKEQDLAAQRATVSALKATITAQQERISQLRSEYHSNLQKELADIRAKILQLEPTLDKTIYKEGLMELRAPQDGIIKDLATTTVGAVVQPGTVVMTLVPDGEKLFADVNIKNEDVGFVQTGQTVRIKLAAYPFQQYGMLTGKVIHLGADATENNIATAANNVTGDTPATTGIATYKARIQLDGQILKGPQGDDLTLVPGMQVVAEINQGKRTVLEYLLSPVEKAVSEAGRER